MIVYLDASALVKRYVEEQGSGEVRSAMAQADGWFICRVGYVEVIRALHLAAGAVVAGGMRAEWPAFSVLEVDERLVESAAALAIQHELRSRDALHLASALLLPADELLLATWNRRLHTAAAARQIAVLPETLG